MTNEEMKNLIIEFNHKLTSTNFDAKKYENEELKSILKKIVDNISTDYATYRMFVGPILSLLNKNSNTSFLILALLYNENHNKLIKKMDLINFEEMIFADEMDPSLPQKFLKLASQHFESHTSFRLSDFDVDPSELSEKEIDSLISLIIEFIHGRARELNWTQAIVEDVLINLAILRSLLKRQRNVSSFYYIVGSVFDRLNSSDEYQLARDLAEEVLICSYQDEVENLGFYNSFKCYSNNSSVIEGLFYILLCQQSTLNKNSLSDKLMKELVWQQIKFFRNISFYAEVENIYHSIPLNIDFNGYELRAIKHSYFVSLLQQRKPNLPSLILDFLNESREEILSTGFHDVVPWLVTLYNIQRIYPELEFSPTGLGYYLSIFESIVPPEAIKNFKDINEGNNLNEALKTALIKLNNARSSEDVVIDNKKAIVIANRLIPKSIENNDIESIMLALMVKSDFSFTFLSKEVNEKVQVALPDTSADSFERIYGDGKEIINHLTAEKKYTVLWLMVVENIVYQMLLNKGVFTSSVNVKWDYEKFRSLVSNGFFSNFNFDPTIKTKNEVREILFEEHEQQSLKLKEEFNFAQIKVSESQEPILVVEDMDLSEFPHNLLLDLNQEFLYLTREICNILSTEWYLKNTNKVNLSKDYTKSIWIPTEGEDFVISYLHSKLEDILSENNFKKTESLEPSEPICSEINIITAHGAEDIALKPAIYPDDNPRLNISSYLGTGKVLILFVCHSGSIKSTLFKNSISSVIKEYLLQGYSSVIAPCWALHIDIPPVWLPEFLKVLNDGGSISKAVHSANMKVYSKFPTLSAWACLHLYGDPNLAIEPDSGLE